MNKNLTIVAATFLVTAIVFIGVSELQKSNARADAVARLKGNYAKLKTSQEKIVATIEANTIINQNKSWFGFSTSGAQVWDGNQGESQDMSWVGNWYASYGGGSAGSTSSWGWYDPTTGQFHEGR